MISAKSQLRLEDLVSRLRQVDPATPSSALSPLLNGLVGWPFFTQVFTVSGVTGEGTEALKEWLLTQGVSRPWK